MFDRNKAVSLRKMNHKRRCFRSTSANVTKCSFSVNNLPPLTKSSVEGFLEPLTSYIWADSPSIEISHSFFSILQHRTNSTSHSKNHSSNTKLSSDNPEKCLFNPWGLVEKDSKTTTHLKMNDSSVSKR
jgi:hypothetical protein